MSDLRKIDFLTQKNFECGGKHFRVIEDPGFKRFKEIQKISLEFGFSATHVDIFNSISTAIEHYNKHEYFNMSIVLYKIQEGIKNLEDKDDPSLRLCALFIIEDGEDLTQCDDAMMKAKIDCWAKELEVGPFFYLAAALVPGWMPSYRLLIQSGSEEKSEKQTENL